MRSATPRRARLNRTAAKWREARVRTIGRCERCKCWDLDRLCLHEIARGSASRSLAFDKAFATLCLCNPKCHNEVSTWTKERQLALLYLRRASDYDLAAFNAISVRRVSQEDVDSEIQKLIGQGA